MCQQQFPAEWRGLYVCGEKRQTFAAIAVGARCLGSYTQLPANFLLTIWSRWTYNYVLLETLKLDRCAANFSAVQPSFERWDLVVVKTSRRWTRTFWALACNSWHTAKITNFFFPRTYDPLQFFYVTDVFLFRFYIVLYNFENKKDLVKHVRFYF